MRVFLFTVTSSLIWFGWIASADAVLAPDTRLSFFVSSQYDWQSRTQVNATLKHTSTWAYMFIEDDYFTSLSAQDQSTMLSNTQTLAQEFDTVIHPRLVPFWGDLPNPGIDNDTRIFILLTRLRNEAGGYIDTANQQTRAQNARSNEKELIYLNAIHLSSTKMKSFLAHELQHLISSNQKEVRLQKEDDVWINESRSEYSPTYVGYDEPYSGSNLNSRVISYLNDPSNSLTAWSGSVGDYGAVNLFGQYLVSRFGQAIFQAIIRNNEVGVPSVSVELLRQSPPLSLKAFFLEWAITSYVNNRNVGDGRYSYSDPDLVAVKLSQPTETQSFGQSGTTLTRSMDDWSSLWINFVPQVQGTTELSLSSTDSNAALAVAAIAEYTNGERNVLHLDIIQNSARVVVDSSEQNALKTVTLVVANAFQSTNFSETALRTSFTVSARIVSQDTPLILQVTPGAAFLAGGAKVKIIGENFTQATEALFGTVKAETRFVSRMELEATVPAQTNAGSVCVGVQHGGQSSSRCGVFTYFAEHALGTLIRSAGDSKVFITLGKYRRHILRSEIFSFYPHMRWENVGEVSNSELSLYEESFWVRAATDPKVYEVNGDLSKHWLNMTAEQFTISGRIWEAVYVINTKERDFYTTGSEVLYR